jgi:hypothetical protein
LFIVHIEIYNLKTPTLFKPFKDEEQAALFKDPVRTAQETLHIGYTNQSVYAVWGISLCLFSDKYKTHKYNVDRVYNC